MRLQVKDDIDNVGVYVQFITPELDRKIMQGFEKLAIEVREERQHIARSMREGRWKIVVKQGKVFFLQKHDYEGFGMADCWIVEFSVQNHNNVMELVKKVIELPRYKGLSAADLVTWFGVNEETGFKVRVKREVEGNVGYYFSRKEERVAHGFRLSAELNRSIDSTKDEQRLALYMGLPLFGLFEVDYLEGFHRVITPMAPSVFKIAAESAVNFRAETWMPICCMDWRDS